ncbi:MAG: ankyrin repeat domain-containing protein [bacterium]|nr:ankyrin repeat domain-containing protein [bacterium]
MGRSYIDPKIEQALAHEDKAFAEAAKAIVIADPVLLQLQIKRFPQLAQARSRSKHRATLLHYVSANAIEDELQLSPDQIYRRLQSCADDERDELKQRLFDVVEMLIQAGAEVDATADAYGGGSAQTPLNWLVSSEHPAAAGVMAELTDLLCRSGAKVDGLEDNSSPLMTSLGFGHPQAARVLVENGCCIDNLPLAAAAGDLQLVREFRREQGFDAGNVGRCQQSWFQLPEDGQQAAELALVFAAMCGQLEVMRFLIARGVDVNAQPPGPHRTSTALYTACLVGQAESVDLLIELGADPTLVEPRYQGNAIGWAEHGGHPGIIRKMRQYVPHYLHEHEGQRPAVKAFVDAVFSGDVSQLRTVLDQHELSLAQINGPWFHFDSPAVVQAKANLPMVDCLLDAGADINRKSLWWAGGFGVLDETEEALAEKLIQRGARLDVWSAAGLGRLSTLQQLIEADGKLVHAAGPDGKTPLHCATSVSVAAYLISKGADLDARCVDHESTPLQYLVVDHPEVARYLISRGCQTDIMAASVLGDVETAERILDKNPQAIECTVDRQNFPSQAADAIYSWKLGWYVTPHMVAKKFGHAALVAFLMHRSSPTLQLMNACLMEDEQQVELILSQYPKASEGLRESHNCQLAHAARNNRVKAVGLLLRHGWPVDARGQHQASALHWAAFHGNRAMVDNVLQHSPDLEARDGEFHSTPLEWALQGVKHGWSRHSGDYPGVVAALREAGCLVPKPVPVLGIRAIDRLLANA